MASGHRSGGRRARRGSGRRDAVIVGGGHNGLVAAALLARAGLDVVVLERGPEVGGAAVSATPFPGVDVRMSRYAYLVSLFPRPLLRSLGVDVEIRPRGTAASGLPATRLEALAGVPERVFPTLTEPLRSREDFRRLVGEPAWTALFEEPLSGLLERELPDDKARGIALTDGLIGTFARADDPALRQNRCFLYHVIGNGTGSWDVPVGGMGALSRGLAHAARAAGAEIRTRAEVTELTTDGVAEAEATLAGGERIAARHVLANVAPALLARLLGAPPPSDSPEGAQLKLNMLLTRLPRLRRGDLDPERAFRGTFHVNESYTQLQLAHDQAAAGRIPETPPCEFYCHSLTDPSILSAEIRAAGAHTLTLFGLHMPARLFRRAGAVSETARADALAATLRSVNSVLAEPIEDCLWLDADGNPCLEALTPPELEAELGMPGGHIFHRDLAWPFAEHDAEVGTWGVETEHANVWVCGAGARRGGGVSGIPGHNAARAVLAAAA